MREDRPEHLPRHRVRVQLWEEVAGVEPAVSGGMTYGWEEG